MFVCCERRGEIVGVAGLHVLGEDLAEVRSLVVSHIYAGKVSDVC